MNHIFLSAPFDEAPARFYPRYCTTTVFNYRTSFKGEGKWRNIYRMLQDWPTNIVGEPYDEQYFWFPDPDLEFDSSLPGELFRMARENKLDLCQPSLTLDSYASHPFLKNAGRGLRAVPHIEIGMPCFSFAALQRNYWTFNLNYSGFGIDLLWGQKEKCWVIDELQVRHPSSPGYENTCKIWGLPDPHRELEEVRRLYLKHPA